MSHIILSNEFLEMGIVPETGASVSFLKYKKNDVWRALDKDKKTYDANDMAMFLQIPFAGRIRGGSFVYWGITRKMAKNQIGVHDPIHGDAWKSAWTVIEAKKDHAVLKMVHDKAASGFPFSYEAIVTYALKKDTLTIEMNVRNSSVLPMPVGLGVHPYFLKTKDVELAYTTKTVWANESDPILDKPYNTPEKWDFKEGKELGKTDFDTCFGGWNGTAQITYPGTGVSVELTADEQFGHIVLYSPRGKNYFCLEPATNSSNAFNLAASGVIGTGIKSIGPNQSVSGKIAFKFKG